jgi:hypothetical protein
LIMDSERGNIAFSVIRFLVLCDVNIHSGLWCLNEVNLESKANKVTV